VAEWLRNGLQNRVHQFNSGRGLHHINDLACGINIEISVSEKSAFTGALLSSNDTQKGRPWRRARCRIPMLIGTRYPILGHQSVKIDRPHLG
jgi:hypothetical protein